MSLPYEITMLNPDEIFGSKCNLVVPRKKKKKSPIIS